MVVTKEVAPKFADYVFDWDYKTYLNCGGYGSGKSYNTAFKIVLKCLQETRKVLVVREVFETLKESCFDLFHEILDEMDILDEDGIRRRGKKQTKVIERQSPMQFIFPNGSRIIFRGMDKPAKVKSINGVSIVWLEECSEIKYDGYKELLGRLRTPQNSLHFLLTCNPVGRENWVYQHFFMRTDDDGNQHVIQDEEEFYRLGVLVNHNVYYMHSTPDDNPWLPADYLKTLDDIKTYDYPLWRVARLGRFGPSGTRVLPQFTIATDPISFVSAVKSIPQKYHYYGFDFGFEESYNAVISMAVDHKRKYLYIYDEIYKNQVTDDIFAEHPKMIRLREKQVDILDMSRMDEDMQLNPLVADNEDPKAISYYRQQGFFIRGCRNKFAGSRLSNTRKVKRFRKIICSPRCTNTIRELKDLTYKKDSKGNVIYDQFNIDPHTFSAIWYGLDTCTVADIKERKSNSQAG